MYDVEMHAKRSYWEVRKLKSTKDMWDALKDNFGVTSVTRLHTLITKFDNYKKDPQHFIKKHLHVMAAMIRDLMAAAHKMSDEYEIQGILAFYQIPSDGIILSTTWLIQRLSRSLLISSLISSLKKRDLLWISLRNRI